MQESLRIQVLGNSGDQPRTASANPSPENALLRICFGTQTAVHLVAAGVDITVIRSWLGHANLDTKRSALEKADQSAFVANQTGTFGNLGHNALYGPRQINMDLALSRTFTLRERPQLEARAEAFNFINHTDFNALSISALAVVGIPTGLNSSTFGKPQSAGDPRILQFALKLRF